MRDEENASIELMLKENGICQSDINAAIFLKMFLNTLDDLVFPRDPCSIIIFPRYRSKMGKKMVFYSRGQVGAYIIYANGLAKGAERRLGKWHCEVSLSESLASIAVHEVRHRFQNKCSPRTFRPEQKIRTGDDFVDMIIAGAENSFDKERIKYLREKRSRNYIRMRIGSREFDATIIETLALYFLVRKHPLKDVAEIIKVGTMSKTA